MAEIVETEDAVFHKFYENGLKESLRTNESASIIPKFYAKVNNFKS